MVQDLTEFLKQSAAKGEKAETTITEPSFNEEFREQKRRERKPSDDADKKNKKSATSSTGVNGPQLLSKHEAPTQNLTPLRSTEMVADQGNDADDKG
jgi:hypothetical protein